MKIKKDLIALEDVKTEEIFGILDLAHDVKSDRAKYSASLQGKSLGLIFQKPSNRTRVSFEVGMFQLGGHSLYLRPNEIGMGGREATKDVARVLARYLDGIVARTYNTKIWELARYADIPVINGLSDIAHPCQALTDIFTIKEKLGRLKGLPRV